MHVHNNNPSIQVTIREKVEHETGCQLSSLNQLPTGVCSDCYNVVNEIDVLEHKLNLYREFLKTNIRASIETCDNTVQEKKNSGINNNKSSMKEMQLLNKVYDKSIVKCDKNTPRHKDPDFKMRLSKDSCQQFDSANVEAPISCSVRSSNVDFPLQLSPIALTSKTNSINADHLLFSTQSGSSTQNSKSSVESTCAESDQNNSTIFGDKNPTCSLDFQSSDESSLYVLKHETVNKQEKLHQAAKITYSQKSYPKSENNIPITCSSTQIQNETKECCSDGNKSIHLKSLDRISAKNESSTVLNMDSKTFSASAPSEQVPPQLPKESTNCSLVPTSIESFSKSNFDAPSNLSTSSDKSLIAVSEAVSSVSQITYVNMGSIPTVSSHASSELNSPDSYTSRSSEDTSSIDIDTRDNEVDQTSSGTPVPPSTSEQSKVRTTAASISSLTDNQCYATSLTATYGMSQNASPLRPCCNSSTRKCSANCPFTVHANEDSLDSSMNTSFLSANCPISLALISPSLPGVSTYTSLLSPSESNGASCTSPSFFLSLQASTLDMNLPSFHTDGNTICKSPDSQGQDILKKVFPTLRMKANLACGEVSEDMKSQNLAKMKSNNRKNYMNKQEMGSEHLPPTSGPKCHVQKLEQFELSEKDILLCKNIHDSRSTTKELTDDNTVFNSTVELYEECNLSNSSSSHCQDLPLALKKNAACSSIDMSLFNRTNVSSIKSGSYNYPEKIQANVDNAQSTLDPLAKCKSIHPSTNCAVKITSSHRTQEYDLNIDDKDSSCDQRYNSPISITDTSTLESIGSRSDDGSSVSEYPVSTFSTMHNNVFKNSSSKSVGSFYEVHNGSKESCATDNTFSSGCDQRTTAANNDISVTVTSVLNTKPSFRSNELLRIPESNSHHVHTDSLKAKITSPLCSPTYSHFNTGIIASSQEHSPVKHAEYPTSNVCPHATCKLPLSYCAHGALSSTPTKSNQSVSRSRKECSLRSVLESKISKSSSIDDNSTVANSDIVPSGQSAFDNVKSRKPPTTINLNKIATGESSSAHDTVSESVILNYKTEINIPTSTNKRSIVECDLKCHSPTSTCSFSDDSFSSRKSKRNKVIRKLCADKSQREKILKDCKSSVDIALNTNLAFPQSQIDNHIVNNCNVSRVPRNMMSEQSHVENVASFLAIDCPKSADKGTSTVADFGSNTNFMENDNTMSCSSPPLTSSLNIMSSQDARNQLQSQRVTAANENSSAFRNDKLNRIESSGNTRDKIYSNTEHSSQSTCSVGNNTTTIAFPHGQLKLSEQEFSNSEQLHSLQGSFKHGNLKVNTSLLPAHEKSVSSAPFGTGVCTDSNASSARLNVTQNLSPATTSSSISPSYSKRSYSISPCYKDKSTSKRHLNAPLNENNAIHSMQSTGANPLGHNATNIHLQNLSHSDVFYQIIPNPNEHPSNLPADSTSCDDFLGQAQSKSERRSHHLTNNSGSVNCRPSDMRHRTLHSQLNVVNVDLNSTNSSNSNYPNFCIVSQSDLNNAQTSVYTSSEFCAVSESFKLPNHLANHLSNAFNVQPNPFGDQILTSVNSLGSQGSQFLKDQSATIRSESKNTFITHKPFFSSPSSSQQVTHQHVQTHCSFNNNILSDPNHLLMQPNYIESNTHQACQTVSGFRTADHSSSQKCKISQSVKMDDTRFQNSTLSTVSNNPNVLSTSFSQAAESTAGNSKGRSNSSRNDSNISTLSQVRLEQQSSKKFFSNGQIQTSHLPTMKNCHKIDSAVASNAPTNSSNSMMMNDPSHSQVNIQYQNICPYPFQDDHHNQSALLTNPSMLHYPNCNTNMPQAYHKPFIQPNDARNFSNSYQSSNNYPHHGCSTGMNTQILSNSHLNYFQNSHNQNNNNRYPASRFNSSHIQGSNTPQGPMDGSVQPAENHLLHDGSSIDQSAILSAGVPSLNFISNQQVGNSAMGVSCNERNRIVAGNSGSKNNSAKPEIIAALQGNLIVDQPTNIPNQSMTNYDSNPNPRYTSNRNHNRQSIDSTNCHNHSSNIIHHQNSQYTHNLHHNSLNMMPQNHPQMQGNLQSQHGNMCYNDPHQNLNLPNAGMSEQQLHYLTQTNVAYNGNGYPDIQCLQNGMQLQYPDYQRMKIHPQATDFGGSAACNVSNQHVFVDGIHNSFAAPLAPHAPTNSCLVNNEFNQIQTIKKCESPIVSRNDVNNIPVDMACNRFSSDAEETSISDQYLSTGIKMKNTAFEFNAKISDGVEECVDVEVADSSILDEKLKSDKVLSLKDCDESIEQIVNKASGVSKSVECTTPEKNISEHENIPEALKKTCALERKTPLISAVEGSNHGSDVTQKSLLDNNEITECSTLNTSEVSSSSRRALTTENFSGSSKIIEDPCYVLTQNLQIETSIDSSLGNYPDPCSVVSSSKTANDIDIDIEECDYTDDHLLTLESETIDEASSTRDAALQVDDSNPIQMAASDNLMNINDDSRNPDLGCHAIESEDINLEVDSCPDEHQSPGRSISRPATPDHLRSVQEATEYHKPTLLTRNFKMKKHAKLQICRQCDQVFSTRQCLVRHIERRHKVCPFICTKCSKKCNSEKALARHMLQHKTFTCKLCSETFVSRKTFKKHVDEHSRGSLACNYCSKECSTVQALISHLNSHKKEKSKHICSVCSKEFANKRNLSVHARTHTGDKPHTCSNCNKSFNVRSNMLAHEEMCLDKCRFKCEICDRGFSLESLYKRHMAEHKGLFAHSCPHCKKGFSKLSGLKAHMKTHINDADSRITPISSSSRKNYSKSESTSSRTKCPICDKYLSRHQLLKDHLARHANQRNYKCPDCDEVFFYKSNILPHRRAQHMLLKPHGCLECSKTFSSKSSLSVHMASHSKEKPHVCGVCGKAFAIRSNFTRHLKCHSGTDNE